MDQQTSVKAQTLGLDHFRGKHRLDTGEPKSPAHLSIHTDFNYLSSLLHFFLVFVPLVSFLSKCDFFCQTRHNKNVSIWMKIPLCTKMVLISPWMSFLLIFFGQKYSSFAIFAKFLQIFPWTKMQFFKGSGLDWARASTQAWSLVTGWRKLGFTHLGPITKVTYGPWTVPSPWTAILAICYSCLAIHVLLLCLLTSCLRVHVTNVPCYIIWILPAMYAKTVVRIHGWLTF